MKRLIITLMLIAGCFAIADAQITKVNGESPYERLMEKRLKINFRNYAIEALDLNKDQIINFDPIFLEYIRKKSNVADKKISMLEDYMKQSENKKKAQVNFIEDFYGLELNEMSMEKRYFKRFADAIGVDNAVEFYLMEDAAQNRMKNEMYADKMPVLIRIERFSVLGDKKDMPETPMKKRTAMNMKHKAAVDGFINWVKKSDADESWDYLYAARGLEAMAGAIMATYEASDWEAKNVEVRVKNIMEIAQQLKDTPVTDNQADIMREGVRQAAELLNDIQEKNDLAFLETETTTLQTLSYNIKDIELLENQTGRLNNYFREAASILEQMSWHIDWNIKTPMDYKER